LKTAQQPSSGYQPVVEIRDLVKRFGTRVAVNRLSCSICPGECLGLLGPNGAGKTTTIHMILGLVRPTSGKIRILNENVPEKLRYVKMRIGVSPQADNLDPDLSVLENLLTYASYFRIKRSTALKRAKELLGFFALQNRSSDIIQHLSGGQRRRLLLSRALINNPELLILDEPTIGLDPQARHLIWERLEALKSKGTTMLLTSHYMEEVSYLADRVMIMAEGRVIARGEPEEMVLQSVGRDVYEVVNGRESLDALEEALESCNVKTERTADRLFIYTVEPCPDLDTMAIRYRRVTKRPATLEDLFLKLTGRTLREN